MNRAVVLAMIVAGCGVEVTGSNSTTGQPPVIGGTDGGLPSPDPGSGSDPASGSGSDAGSSAITPRGFLHEAGVKQCNEAYKCIDSYPGTQAQFESDWGTSTQDCYDITDVLFEIAQVVAEIAAGNVTFDPTAAEACLEGVTYGGCTAFWQNGAQFPAICSQVLVGTAATGASCVVDYDCASGICGSTNTCQAN